LRYYHANLFDLTASSAQQSIVVFLVLSAVMHFGSLSFQKLAFIKMALCVILVAGTIYWLNFTGLRSLIHETNMPGGKYFSDSIRLGDEEQTRGFVVLPDQWKNTIRIVLPGVLYLSFWTASYFKLREKQI